MTHLGAGSRALCVFAACAGLVASGCEYATEAVVLTRVNPSSTIRDAAPPAADVSADRDVAFDASANGDVQDAQTLSGQTEASVDNFGVLPERLRLLDRGFEVQDWMRTQYRPGWLSATELRTLQISGFRNLRIAFGMPLLLDDNAPGVLKPAALANYDEIIDQVLAAGLAVVIHPSAQLAARDWSDPAYIAKMSSFWRAFADHLAKTNRDPGRVFLKIEFDPDTPSADTWYTAQQELLAAVREVDPERTILLTPNALTRSMDRNTITAVTEVPAGPTNVVFDFGFFSPPAFTHQSADWREVWMKDLHDLPYPSSPAACAPVLPTILTAAARSEAQAYCEASYGRQTIANLFAPAVTWAKSSKVKLINGAFGVYKPRVPPTSRLAWLEDVRSVLEANGIPWTYYDETPGFSMLIGTVGRRTVEPDVLTALGLRAP